MTNEPNEATEDAPRPGDMRAHLVFSFGAFLESQLLNETKEQGQCSSLSDSSNG